MMCLVSLLAACGKKDDEVVTTTAAVGQTCTVPGQVWNAQYGCLQAQGQYGYPGQGTGTNYQPVDIYVPQGNCQSGYGQYPYGYGQNRCYNRQRTQWYYHNNFYFYYYY